MPADLDSPELYINRELSWLEFNDRVLREGLSQDVPLLERLKFLSIVSSNLDEFFMIRVAGLKQQQAAKLTRKDPSGLTPAEQLAAILRPRCAGCGHGSPIDHKRIGACDTDNSVISVERNAANSRGHQNRKCIPREIPVIVERDSY